MVKQLHQLKKLFTKAICLVMVLTGVSNFSEVNAQALTGTKTIPGSYSSIQAAVADLNTNGVGTGGVIFNITAGYTETLTTPIVLTATGTALNQIIFQKDPLSTGANPLITAYTGTLLASSTGSVDGIWTFVGSDFITIDGIDLLDPATNTTATTTMEFGYGFYKASATNGANNNTVKNCTITLNRVNNTTAAAPRWHGSVGIELVATTPTAVGTTITQTSISGASSNNKFYSNTIQNCNGGIALGGAAIVSPYTLADLNNDVGGSSAATGNTIINFGGGTGATNACAAVWASNQWSFNISYNTVNNNTGTGINHAATNRGIFAAANSIGASATMNNNNVTIIGGASTTAIDWAIDCEMAQSGANGNTISINNNTISITKSVATAVALTAIWVQSAPTTVNVNGNTINNFVCSSTATADVAVIRSGLAGISTLNINNNTISGVNFTAATGTDYIISVLATVNNALNINNNKLNGVTLTGATSKILRNIYVSTATTTCTVNISNDTFQNLTYSGGTPTGEFSLIYGLGTAASYNINNNILIGSLTIPTTGSVYLIQNNQSTPNVTVSGNRLSGTGINKTGAGGVFNAYYNFGSPGVGTANIVNNNCSNITLTGATTFNGFEYRTSTSQIIKISNNVVTNIFGGTGVKYGIYQAYGAVGSTIDNNYIYGLSGGGIIYGIYSGSTTAPLGLDCYKNRVDSIVATGTGLACGIYNALGSGTISFYRNKINNIINTNAGGTSNGIQIAGGATINIHNNLIGNILAPTSSGSNQVVGLNITGGTTHNIYYNTISLNASSTGTIFGSSALSVNTTPTTIVLRNNIFTNTSTANTTGLTVAYRRASTALTNYSNLSNSNLFYAGAPSATNLVFHDGTNGDQTISALKGRLVTFEQSSFTENPTFLSTVGSDNDFLHLSLSIPTQCESGGANISGFPIDYDSIVRQGNTGYLGVGSATDVGADEGEFIGVSMVLDSSNVDQISLAVPVNTTNQQIVALRVHTSNNLSPLNITSLKLNTAGTTNVSDIQNARVYYTGSNPVFSAINQFGSTVVAPNGTFYVSGSRTLASGVNYFWVTYDVKSTATINSTIDVRVDSLLIGGVNTAPLNGNPAGSRTIQTPLNGNYNVGVGQTFGTITEAVNNLNILGVSGPVTFVLKDALYNTGSGEVFPIVFNNYTNSSSINTLTIRPDFATISRIESSNSTATFDLNGISNLIIDGRQGGIGGFTSGNNLTIANTNVNGPTIRFINEASSNRILYTDLRSNNIIAPGTIGAGVVNFGTTTGVNGNDNNIIRYCDIHEDGVGNPTVGISSIGSATTVATNNDGNIIDSCNIYNYFHPIIATSGIYVGANNGSWVINANRMFQTATITTTGTQTHRAMWITPNTASLTSASGFIITNNFIGGNSSAGTGIYTMSGTTLYQFMGMDISVGVGTATSIQNNTITNMSITGGFTGNNVYGINVANGNVNVGTITGNLIGSTTTNGAITFTTTATNGSMIALRSGAGGIINFSNNIVSGIDLIGNATTVSTGFNGIAGSGGSTIIINNNTIGSTTLANSINMVSTSSTSVTASAFRGIICNSTTTGVVNSITNNIIANLNTNYAATGTQATSLVGIAVTTGTSTVTGNIIRNLTTATQTTAGGSTSAIVGLAYTSTTAPTLISGNTINNLVLTGTSTSAAVQCEGLFYGGATSGTNIISKNNIHSLSLNAVNPAVFLTAMDIGSGLVTISNNMIRLGYDSLGNSISTPCVFRGISKNVAITNVYFNSIYIGGTGVGTTATNTFAFQRTASATSDDVRNNIFVNARSNSSIGGKHYQVFLINNTTITLNNNIYFGGGTGSVFGTLNNGTSDLLNYSLGWVSSDLSSGVADPQFVNAGGSAQTGDLHISSTLATPIESNGAFISSVTDDIDGQLRSGLSPTDIGADAGNFVSLDVVPPTILYTILQNTPLTTNRILTATINDATGVYLTGSFMPRIYYKKFISGTWNSAPGTFVSGSKTNGTWNFEINSGALSGLALNDSVYYYVVAQDSNLISNMGSSPAGAVGTDVNTISAHPNAFGYKIVPAVNGVIDVGAGQTFTTLTGANGLFAYINASALVGDLTVRITSDIEEPGTVGLNETVESGAGNYKIKIGPDAATLRSLTGSVTTSNSAIIRLEGADRVKIDGSFLGAGKFIRIMNRVQGAATLNLLNDADNDTITNCIIEGVNNTVGMLNFFGTNKVGGTGNDSNAVIGCIFKDTTGTISTSNIPNTGLFSQGAVNNDFNTIANNDIYNFGYNGINLSTTSGDYWNIVNNRFYQTITKNNAMTIIQVNGGTGHNISGNSFGGSAPDRSGNPFVSSSSITGIAITTTISTVSPFTINNNTFSNMAATGTTNFLKCIAFGAGTATISNNVFGSGVNAYDTLRNAGDGAIIELTGGTATVSNNLLSDYRYYAGSTVYRHVGIYVTSGTHTISGNTIRNIEGNNATTSIGLYAINGIYLNGGTNLVVRGNTISNIRNINTGTAAYLAIGISVVSGTSATIDGNRIFNISSLGGGTGGSAPQVIGVYTSSAGHLYNNNQITLGTNGGNSETVISGCRNVTTSGISNYNFNSIYIGGSSTSVTNNSIGIERTAAGTVNLMNNLIYNGRVSIAGSKNYTLSSVNAITFDNLTYNLLIANDTASLVQLGGIAYGWSGLSSLYTTTYNTNWAERTGNVLANNLFIDTLVGNLGIITSNPEAWYANGKGERIASISGDFNNNSGVRSTTIAGGAVDIGSVEFTPTSTPPIAFADKTPAANDSTQFFFGSRMVAKAVWGSAGTLPSSVAVRYYSGVNPPNTIAGSTFMNAYWNMQATGGSGYSYNLTLVQDSAVLGTVASITNLQMVKYLGTGTNWNRIAATTVNNVTGFMNANSNNTLGIFSATNGASNPLPVKLIAFTASAKNNNVLVSWTTASEENNKGFELESSIDGKNFKYLGFVKGAVNSNTVSNYNLVDANAFVNNASNVIYYRLKQLDLDGQFTYSKVVSVNNDSKTENVFEVFPNPFNTEFNIVVNATEAGNATVETIDLQGKVLVSKSFNTVNGLNTLNMTDLPNLNAGIYVVKVTVNGQTFVHKLVKN